MTGGCTWQQDAKCAWQTVTEHFSWCGGGVAGGSGSSGDTRRSHVRPPLCFLQNGGVISLIDCTLVEDTESTDEDRMYPWSNPTLPPAEPGTQLFHPAQLTFDPSPPPALKLFPGPLLSSAALAALGSPVPTYALCTYIASPPPLTLDMSIPGSRESRESLPQGRLPGCHSPISIRHWRFPLLNEGF